MNVLEMTPHRKESGGKSSDNYLFLNFVGAPQRVLDPVVIERIIGSALKLNGDRINKLNRLYTDLMKNLHQLLSVWLPVIQLDMCSL